MRPSGRDPIRNASGSDEKLQPTVPPWRWWRREAFEARKAQLKSEGKAGRWFSPVELHVLPKLGKVPIEDLDQNHIKSALAPIWHEKGETARKAITRLQVILKHAVAMGLAVDLQATDKARVLLGKSRQKTEHIAALPWTEVPAFYATLTEDSVCHLALRLLILTAVRSAGVRFARSDEIDGTTWVIPGERMKAGMTHRVPLSQEALAVIEKAKPTQPGRLSLPQRPQGRDQRRDDVAHDGAARHGRAAARFPQQLSRLVRRGDRRPRARSRRRHLPTCDGSKVERAYRRTDHP